MIVINNETTRQPYIFRYSNIFLHNNRLLAQVKQRADVTYDDNYGLRKTSAGNNFRGISSYSIILTHQEVPPSIADFMSLQASQQEYTQIVSFAGNSALYLHLVAQDILGNAQVCTKNEKVTMDNFWCVCLI